MKPFDVYPLFDIEPLRAEGSYIYDKSGNKYLDFYGGHAVISIGHSHPHYVKRVKEQVEKIGFYSNSVQMPLQEKLALLLGKISGYTDYNLFLCNSGAEANENALKLASFHTGKRRMISFRKSFHGRTSLAVAVTDNTAYQAPVNKFEEVTFLDLNDSAAVSQELGKGDVAAVIIEGIQGLGGINVPEDRFLRDLIISCQKAGVILILDEVQSGYGRSGKFFAHQYAGIEPDLITVAKGMGNGFPMGGVLINPEFKAVHGMLGTTFGGNHLACAAGIAVLEVIEEEGLIENAQKIGQHIIGELSKFRGIAEVRGRGLMIGIQLEQPAAKVRNKLLDDFKIFTGSAAQAQTIRLLPPLNISKSQTDYFLSSFKKVLYKP